ncbi:MAG: ImmA/IrrE family metallo-endopeptidase [Acidobacteriota bacterium]|nr:ImmA/IrrE family metallo-endopeptidase [Acidobacteriota bacterium]
MFETEWLAAEEIRGPELASTWASLLIRVDDSVVTRVVDERAQTVRDHIYVPLYPLAESLATNWWFMLHEVGNPAKNHDAAFKRRHALVSARDGYAFPNLQVASSETRTCLAWTPEALRWARLDYQGENQVWIDKDEFRECCAELVDRVIRRLVSCGIEGTLLQEEWASIEAADQDESHFCRTAAGLGWDPYALSDAQQAAVLRLESILDEAIFDEAITVLDVERLDADAAAIATALDPGNGTRLPLEHVRAACIPPTPRAGGMPWQAGYALARDVRQRLGLDGEPLPSIASLGEALRENPDALAAATQGRDFGGAGLVNGVVATDADGLPAFALRGGPEANRRFHFCRGLAEVLTSPGSPALLTRAQSDRQQRSRAFAAEFLAPAAALQARVPRPVLDEEDVEELAAEFGVSPLLISHQLENHQIARIG